MATNLLTASWFLLCRSEYCDTSRLSLAAATITLFVNYLNEHKKLEQTQNFSGL